MAMNRAVLHSQTPPGVPEPKKSPTVRGELGRVSTILERNPGLTESQIRAWIFRRTQNGLWKHVHHVGRTVLVDMDGFAAWVRGER